MAGNKSATDNGSQYERNKDLRLFLEPYFSGNGYYLDSRRKVENSVAAYNVYDSLGELKYILAQKSQFYKVKEVFTDFEVQISRKKDSKGAPWRREPDESLIDLENHVIYLVEKKTQKVDGSVDEKLLGFSNTKKWYQAKVNNRSIINQWNDSHNDIWNVKFGFLGELDRWGTSRYVELMSILQQEDIKVMLDSYDITWFDTLR